MDDRAEGKQRNPCLSGLRQPQQRRRGDHPVMVVRAGGPRYTGAVRVLTSDLSISAGETFIEALMGRKSPPTRFGTTTQGVFADDMRRKLPDGWDFTVGNGDYIASDGRNYENTGIPPTTQIRTFTPAQQAQHHDPALDAALRTPWSNP